MNCLEQELKCAIINNSVITYPVIIVAAGSSSRMKGIDKLSTDILGISVIERTISTFDKSNNICEIVVVTKQDKISEYRKFNTNKPYTVVLGGNSREDSVLCGIKYLNGRYEKALIHDGARPFVSECVIQNVCEALSTNDSVTSGVKVNNTIKVVDEDMNARKTLTRDFLYSIQTPQGISLKLFMNSAEKNNLSLFTDDTSVLEAEGVITKIVEGDYINIKITTPEDLLIAKALISKE